MPQFIDNDATKDHLSRIVDERLAVARATGLDEAAALEAVKADGSPPREPTLAEALIMNRQSVDRARGQNPYGLGRRG